MTRRQLSFALIGYLVIVAILGGCFYALLNIKPSRDGIAQSTGDTK